MDRTDQNYRSSSETNPQCDFITIDGCLYTGDAWLRASPDEIQGFPPRHPTSTELGDEQGDEESPFGSNGSGTTRSGYGGNGFERSSFDQMLFTDPDLINDSVLNSLCTTTPGSVDEQDGLPATVSVQNGRSRWMENASQGNGPDKEERLARRQAQNREAQRAHRAKQKSKLSTLESRVRLAESNCRLLEEANQRMEDVLRNLVNDAVKVLASPARSKQPGHRPSRFAMDG